jgi:chemotaxis protein CheX
MNVEYINPFIVASQTVIKLISGIDAKLGKIYLKDSPFKGENVVIIVGLTGKMRGQVTFSMNIPTALNIASKMMMGMPVNELDEMARSAISELTNMILGNTATLLYNKGIGIEITPPSFLMGDNLQISYSKMQTICVPLYLNENETMDIDISIQQP